MFGTALYLRGEKTPAADEGESVTVLERRPDVVAKAVDGGTSLVVRYTFAGACSRAKVVYRHHGEERVLASTTECRRRVGELESDGYLNEVELTGTLPSGATEIQLVLESETGIRVAPVEF